MMSTSYSPLRDDDEDDEDDDDDDEDGNRVSPVVEDVTPKLSTWERSWMKGSLTRSRMTVSWKSVQNTLAATS